MIKLYETMSKIGFIGSGNVAYRLAIELKEQGFCITQIFNRTEANATKLCEVTGASYISNISSFRFEDNDLNIISLSDDVLQYTLQNIYVNSSILVHTSGSLPIEILKEYSKNYGVIYPLQTINKDKRIDFKSIPILIEADKESNLLKLQSIVDKLSNNIVVCNSEQREMVHIAAIFVSNFTNYMYTIGYDLIQSSGLDFEILKPLIQQTALRLGNGSPKQLQTGPAKRADIRIINKHLERLNNFKEYQNLYKILSQKILNQNE